jgi:hypothetical protein
MNKKSINCLQKDNQSSRTELHNAALDDIIPTNDVTSKKVKNKDNTNSQAILLEIYHD